MNKADSAFWELSKEAKILLPIMIALGGGFLMLLGQHSLQDEVEANTIINCIQEEQVTLIRKDVQEIKGILFHQNKLLSEVHTAVIKP